MLVEDDPAVAQKYQQGLEIGGFRVITLSDASAFFQGIEDEIPEIAVLDFQLGDLITGLDILDNLRLDGRTAHLPVLVLSNNLGDFDGHIDRAIEAGALAWLVKSHTTPSQLAARVSEALGSLVSS
ncbi:MAG: response regulator [Candidatus Dormibacteraeota bacterium]|nr:response regulator [Candidatus Dormibacteraeota bacterium]